jgi:hypothetical protein
MGADEEWHADDADPCGNAVLRESLYYTSTRKVMRFSSFPEDAKCLKVEFIQTKKSALIRVPVGIRVNPRAILSILG